MAFDLTGGFVTKANRRGFGGQGKRITGLGLDALPGSMKEMGQKALSDAAVWFQKKRMPAKFTVRAYDRYGGKEPDVFQERKGRRNKNGDVLRSRNYQVQGGKIRPLYRSGLLRAHILRGTLNTKATGSGVGMKVRAWWSGLPRYTYMKRTDVEPSHNKVRELTMMDAEDVRGMAAEYQKSLKKSVRGLEG